MIINHCFKAAGFALAGVLSLAITCMPSALAQQEAIGPGTYIIDTSTGKMTRIEIGPWGSATAINDAGQVTGFSGALGGGGHGFITGHDGVGMRDLGTLGGWGSRGYDISNTGQVTGVSGMPAPAGGEHAFITGSDGEGMRDLGTLKGNNSEGLAINDMGQVAGLLKESRDAFITGPDGAGMRNLGNFGWNSRGPTGINNSGQVVGAVPTGPHGLFHAFITGPDGHGVRDLGTLGGSFSGAGGINDAGQVIGWAQTAAPGAYYHAFITGPDGLGMRDLGTLTEGQSSWSRAAGINDAGQVVGSSSDLAGPAHGFVTGPDGNGMTDLNSLVDLPGGLYVTEARDINNLGQIIATIIPEPQSYAMLLAGLALLGFMGALLERRKIRLGIIGFLKPFIPSRG
jgi:probable HAF family extracellular repeat protein